MTSLNLASWNFQKHISPYISPVSKCKVLCSYQSYNMQQDTISAFILVSKLQNSTRNKQGFVTFSAKNHWIMLNLFSVRDRCLGIFKISVNIFEQIYVAMKVEFCLTYFFFVSFFKTCHKYLAV